MLNEKERLALKAARFYYFHGLKQDEIAAKLGISRSKVSRLLTWARKNNLVRVIITPSTCADLEESLTALYQKHFLVVEVPESSMDQTRRAIGTAAALFLTRRVEEGMMIGISWGRTLAEMVEVTPPIYKKDVKVVQLVGGLGNPELDTHATNITVRLARQLHAKPIPLLAPGIVENVEVKAMLLADSYIRQVFKLFSQLDFALVGIGTLSPNSFVLTQGQILQERDVKLLQKRGAVGDIALRYFDSNGRPLPTEVDERVIGIDLVSLKNLKEVVGVAGGREKVTAIHAALKGGLIDTLVTDAFTAESLLKFGGEAG